MVQGVTITWLAPHAFSQPPAAASVDFRVMATFLDFYTTLIAFVLFRLYASCGLAYPPTHDARVSGPARGLIVSESPDAVPQPVEERVAGAIGRGLLVLVGAAEDDDPARTDWIARKVAELRIFPDAHPISLLSNVKAIVLPESTTERLLRPVQLPSR